MNLNLQFIQIYSISYEFQKFKLNLEMNLNKSDRKDEMELFHWTSSTEAANSARLRKPTHQAFRPTNEGNR
jgi:hypothetical protein